VLKSRLLPILGIVLLVITGCGKKNQTETVAETVAGNSPELLAGKVEETMDSGGYTYIRINKGNQDIWVAGPVTAIKVGEEVSFPTGMKMENFQATSLDRTFDLIYFVSNISKSGGQEKPEKVFHGNVPVSNESGTPKPQNKQINDVTPLANGITVADLFENKNNYAGKVVRFRGQVVKYSAEIMGKNWLHIQDGTDYQGSFDVTVTSNAEAKVGDIVIVEGKLSLDRDFGFGYKYDLIIEKASVTH